MFIVTDFQERHQNLLKFHFHFQLKREEQSSRQSEHAGKLFLLSGTYYFLPQGNRSVSFAVSTQLRPAADITGVKREQVFIQRVTPTANTSRLWEWVTGQTAECVVALVTNSSTSSHPNKGSQPSGCGAVTPETF